VSLHYDLAAQRATLKANHSATVVDRSLRLRATYKPHEGSNNLAVECSHAPSKEADVTAIFNVGSRDATLKAVYAVDSKTSLEPEATRSGKSGAVSWNLKAVHRLTAVDRVEATLASVEPSARLSYTRSQDGVEITVGAPLSSSLVADASVKIERCFDF